MTSIPAEHSSWVPAHVPPELIWDQDLNAYARTLNDPFSIAADLQKGPEIIWSRGATRGEPGWVPTRFALLQEIFMDTERFSSVNNVGISKLLGVDWCLNPFEVDPPDHMAYRLVMQPLFQPAAINKLEATIRRIAHELLANFEANGACEFMEDFAVPFPSHVFLELFGLPREMLPQFLEWETAFIRGRTLEERTRAIRAIKDYLEAYVERRRSDQRDDVTSAILKGQIKGRPLNHGEIMGMCMVLYLGGLDTVLSSLGWQMHHVAKDQSLQDRLRANARDIPGAVDDLLRAYGVTTTRRYVTRDLNFHGVDMKKGDRILMATYFASRDPERYPNPAVVDPDRGPRHLTFATGVHNCIGAHLARREMRVVLDEFLTRFKNIRVSDESRVTWQTDGVWSITRLPLAWD